MTDRGEGGLRKWALNRNGKEITNRDIVELVFAFADDFDEALTKRDTQVDALCMQVEEINEWRREQQATCVDRVKKLIHDEHDVRHNKHISDHHSLQDERADWLIRSLGARGASVAIFLLGTTLAAVISYLIWGAP